LLLSRSDLPSVEATLRRSPSGSTSRGRRPEYVRIDELLRQREQLVDEQARESADGRRLILG
jgi:hypothetical protein